MSVSSSDSEHDARVGYQPILAERLRSGVDSPSAGSSPGMWPRDAMNVYTNDLFKDEDIIDNVGIGGHPQPERPGSSQKMMAQKSALAQRRAERLQANIYQSNSNSMTRAPGPAGPPRPPPLEQHHLPDNQGVHQQQQQQDSNSVFGLKGTYDPNDEQRPRQVAVNGQLGIANPRPGPSPPQLDLSNLPAFLMQPGPKEGLPIMCYIMRDKGSAKMYPRYNLYLEDPKMFLLAARKRKKQTTSNYLVSLDPEDLNRDSSKYFGKLRANFVGTEFTVFDGGDKPDKKAGSSDSGVRQELGCVTYQYNVLGTRGPRKMTGVIPALDAHGRRLYRPANESDNMLDRVKANKGLSELVVMHNKPPRWNDELNAYCLNFNGRVTEASVKNFQLVTEENQNHVILQFGKISKNAFTMDYMWPMNAFQAFSICLSSFDNKLACE